MQSKCKIISLSAIIEKLKEERLLTKTRGISYSLLSASVNYPITDTRQPGKIDKTTSLSDTTTPLPSFICIKGTIFDGHRFVDEAIQSGIKLFFLEQEQDREDILQIVVKDTRKALAALADLFFEEPAKKIFLVGVTGTNGKTSIVKILENILLQQGMAVGSIGTLGYSINGKQYDLERTTPDITELHMIFKEMVQNDIKYVVMEVSSHSLKLDRVYGLEFDIAVFTNLSRDHLDFHPDMEDYYSSKKKLFDHLKGPAFINIDDPYGTRLWGDFSGVKYRISSDRKTDSNPDISYQIKKTALDSTDFEVTFGEEYSQNYLSGKDTHQTFKIKSPMLGSHNAFNITTAISVAKVITKNPISDLIASLPSNIPGRLERVKNKHNIYCFIDYAHTPEALFRTCRTITDGIKLTHRNRDITAKKRRFITVFGAGGDRDRGKRKEMTDAAFSYSDYVILTTDNPRSENPADIINDMVEHLDPISNYWIILDRKKAIETAVSLATENDVILIAGKGHEKYQELVGQRIPFDDYQIAQQAIIKIFEGRNESGTDSSIKADIEGFSPASIDLSVPVNLLVIRLLLEENDNLLKELSWQREKEQKVYRSEDNHVRIKNLESKGLTEHQHNIKAISTDTRTIRDYSLFFALKGKNFDGHDFVEIVLEKENNWAVVEHSFPVLTDRNQERRLIRVQNTHLAYATLAKKYRNLFKTTLIAITGSSGKTTTKEYCSNILSVNHRVLKNIANENNLLGVAKTLFRLSPSHDFAVIEIGSNKIGEIELLADTCQPDIGIVTNIGPSHLEFFHDLNGVFKEKSALLERDLTLGILPGNDELFSRYGNQFIRVSPLDGSSDNNNHYYVDVISKSDNRSEFKIAGDTYSISSGAYFNVLNAAYAVVLARTIGLDRDSIQIGLTKPLEIKDRMEVFYSKGRMIISDCYNANPFAMKIVIDHWLKTEPSLPHIAILGDMLELGDRTVQYHQEIGEHIKQGSTETGFYPRIIAVGKQAKHYLPNKDNHQSFDTVDELINSDILKSIPDKAIILLKGSHSIHLEKIKGRL